MDDGVGIATTLYTPVTHGEKSPAVMLFHGLGGSRQSARPGREAASRSVATSPSPSTSAVTASRAACSAGSARASYSTSRGCERRWLPANAPVDGDKVGALGHLARRRRGAPCGRRGDAVQGARSGARHGPTSTRRSCRRTFRSRERSSSSSARCRARPPGSRAARAARARSRGATCRRCVRSRRRARHASCSRAGTRRRCSSRDAATSRSGSSRGSPAGSATPARRRSTSVPFGHSPSKFPGPDFELVMQRAIQWFDVHVAGAARHAEPAGRRARRREWQDRSQATRRCLRRPGTCTRCAATRRSVPRARSSAARARLGCSRRSAPPTVQVRASSTTGWSHLVAVLVARTPSGQEIVVSDGGAPTSLSTKPKNITIRLISQVTRIPAGSRFELTLAGTSTAQNTANLLYLVPVPQRARITVRNVTLAIPTLRTPVSR